MADDDLVEMLQYIGVYKESHIAKKFRVSRRTVQYHQKRLGIPNIYPLLDIEEYAVPSKNFPDRVTTKDIEKITDASHRQIDWDCDHSLWSKRCAKCSTILESDRQINFETIPTKQLIGNFDGAPVYIDSTDEHTIEMAKQLTTAFQKLRKNIGMLRQYLNEDRISDPKKMVTNEDLNYWLFLDIKNE